MNILLINHYAGSPKYGMEYRPYYLAREWVNAGHQVNIIASSESHVRSSCPALNNQERLDETIDGVQYTWFKTPSYTGNGVGRVKNMTAFILRLFREGKTIANTIKPDIVIASSTYPMDIWPAHRIAKLANAKLIFEVHDLWPLSPMELGGMSKWHPFIILVQQAEDYAYRHADAVVSMLPNAKEHMISHNMDAKKFNYIPNGINEKEWSLPSVLLNDQLSKTIEDAKKTYKLIIGYTGSHGLPNSLDNLLNAAKLMIDDSVLFILIGDGHERKRLASRVEDEKIENVKMFPPIPKSQIPTFLHQIDIAYLGAPKSKLYRFGVSPNKMMDYMMAEKPIIYAIDSGNHPINDANCGIEVPSEDPVALANGLKRIIKSSKIREMGANGKKYVLSQLTYSILAKKFIGIIQARLQ